MPTALSHWSIRTLLVWLVLASLLPGVVGAAILFIHQYQDGRAQLDRDTLQTARALTHAVDSHLLRVEAAAEALATSDALAQGNLARFHDRARQVIKDFELADNVVLRGKNEQLVINALIPFGDPLPSQPSREHVRRVFANAKPVVSDLYTVPQFKHPIISVDVPVFIGGEVAYSLGITVFPEHLNALLIAQNLPAGWVAAMVDSSGTVVGRNITPEKFVGSKVQPILLRALSQSREGTLESPSLEGTPVHAAYSRSALTNWSVAIGIPRASLQQALMQSLARIALGVTALFAIGLTLAWFMGGRIARSVSALTIPAIALGRGESVKPPQVQVREAAEVGTALCHAAELLHHRTAALEARETELAQVHTRLRDVVDSSPALIYLKDLEGHLLLVNKTYKEVIGANHSKVRITSDGLPQVSPEHGPSAPDLQVMQRGEIVRFEEEIETAEGRRYFSVSKAPLRSHEGQIVGICGVAVDVTALKRAESQVRELVTTLEKRVDERTEALRAANTRLVDVNGQLQEANGQLQEANGQLEAFSYTVAHDLRAPLRGIQGFADAVMEDYADKLDAAGQDFLQRISNAAGRMEHLIDDLLRFSRLSRTDFALGPVDLANAFRQALANLQAQIHESSAEVATVGDLPMVWANNTACIQIFQNLISNAIKFAKPHTDVRVRIWAEARVHEHTGAKVVRVWIEDNGIGIPVDKQQRIFKPFERLHGVSQYPGSGIGLAIVDTVTRHMYGQCGVESAVNVGSRFWIELSAMDMEQ